MLDWLSARLNKSKRFNALQIIWISALTNHWLQIFFSCKIIFQWLLHELVTDQRHSLCFAQSFYHSSVYEWKQGTELCLKSNPVQSSRSKLTTCPTKGCVLRFQSNSTATQMAVCKSLEMMSDMILNRSQTKFAAKLVANEMHISYLTAI